VTVANVVYTVDRYVTWVDSDGQGIADTKRFTAVVTWPSRGGGDRSITAVGERIPNQAEAQATSTGARVLAITGAPDPAALVSPTPADLDPPLLNTNAEVLEFTIRLNQEILAEPRPTLSFYSLGDAPGEGDEETYVLRAVEPGNMKPLDGNTRWVATVPAHAYRFAAGSLEVLFTAKDNKSNWIESFGSIRLEGGDAEHQGEAPRPAMKNESGLLFNPPVSNTSGSGDTVEPVVAITSVTPKPTNVICVNNSTWKLSRDIVVDFETKGLKADDGTVTATYNNWPKKDVDPVLVTDSATFQLGSDPQVYRLTIPRQAERLFEPGKDVTFSIKAIRSAGSNASDSLSLKVQTSC
jgi:hypothetical protein